MTDCKSKQNLSLNLKYFISLTGKTNKEVATDLGLSYSTFTDWVNGIKFPRADKLDLLADYFKVSINELIGERVINTPTISSQENWLEQLVHLQLSEDEKIQVCKYAKYLKKTRD